MKKSTIQFMLMLILALTFQTFVSSSWAQSPQKLSYQAVIRNSNNQLVSNHMVKMRISILKGSETGLAVYTETHTLTTNANGLLSIEIGAGMSTDDFTTIDWANGPYYIKTETDPTGGTNYTISGISQLLSVPYALCAKSVENGSVTDATLSGNGTTALPLQVAQQGATTGQALKWNGTSWFPATDENGPWTKSGNSVYVMGENVGIGKSNPSARLHIWTDDNSGISVSNSSSKAALYSANRGAGLAADFLGKVKIVDGSEGTGKVLTSDADGLATWQTPSGSSVWQQNGYNTYYNTGYVGIGTTTPQNDLHIHSTSVYSGLLMTNSASGTTSSDGLILGLQHQADVPTNRFAVLLNRENSSFHIGTNDLYQMTFTPQGFVGIGTTDPQRDLHINSSTIYTGLLLTTATSGTTSSDGLSIGIQYQADAPTNRYTQVLNRENCPLYLGSNGVKNLTIAADGKIGIGTSSPGAGLHVKGTGYPNSFIYLESAANNDAGFRLYEGETAKWHIYNVSGAGGLHICNSAFTTAIFAKQSNSFVGINTTTPNYNLDVNGTAGKTGGGSWSNSSDIRLKNVLGNYTKGISEITSLQPIIFKYKEGNARNLPSTEEQIGFVAQDVQKIFPEAVTKATDGYLDFNFHAINVALVNAVKELKVENDQLKVESEKLRNESDKLKAENELLKTKNDQIDQRLSNLEKIIGVSALK
jgi:hypothetical protein